MAESALIILTLLTLGEFLLIDISFFFYIVSGNSILQVR